MTRPALRAGARGWWVSLLATLITGAGVLIQGGPLKASSVTPAGIVDLELAGTWPRIDQILDAWRQTELLQVATTNLWIDFGFLVSYATFLALSLLLLARGFRRHGHPGWAGFLTVIAAGQWAAGLLDAVENVSLLAMLSGASSRWLPGLATSAATIKFSFVAVGVVVSATAGIVLLVVRR